MNPNLRGAIMNPDKIYGKSAYEIALEHGFVGTEEEWVDYTILKAKEAAESAKRVETMIQSLTTPFTVTDDGVLSQIINLTLTADGTLQLSL